MSGAWAQVPYRMRLALERQALKGGLLSEGVIAECFYFSGHHLDRERLNHAFVQAITRHPALRTRFRVDDSTGPGQQIGDAWPNVVGITECPPGAPLDLAREHLADHGFTPFDLASGRLVRAELFTDELQHALVVSVDHTACDGVSFDQFMHDVALAYREPGSLPAADYTLVHYAVHEAEYHSGPEGARLRSAWRERLPDGIPEMVIADSTPWKDLSPQGVRLADETAPDVYRELQLSAAGMRVTPYMLAVARLLEGMSDAVLSPGWSFIAPLSGRIPGSPMSLVGNLVNLVPVTIHRAEPGDLRSAAQSVRDGVMWALRHQALPLAQIVAEVDPGGPVIAQHRRQIFISGQHRQPLVINGEQLRHLPASYSTALFDLSIWVSTSDNALTLDSIHRQCLVDESAVASWLKHVCAPAQCDAR